MQIAAKIESIVSSYSPKTLSKFFLQLFVRDILRTDTQTHAHTDSYENITSFVHGGNHCGFEFSRGSVRAHLVKDG